ncbi:MAG: hypothetical protein HZB16_18570 [Armatimonadetes bacterium]|nr:hypothetical protein [Armatimonadota bacterium]
MVRAELTMLLGLVGLHAVLLRLAAHGRLVEQVLGGGVPPLGVGLLALAFIVVRALLVLLAPGLAVRVAWFGLRGLRRGARPPLGDAA